MDWFLYDNGPRHERVKSYMSLPRNEQAELQPKQNFVSISIYLSKK